MSAVWSDTFSLMLLGMGTVFVFLLTLIFALYALSFIIPRFSAEDDEPNDKPTPQGSHKEITAAVTAAHYFHNRYK